MKKKLFNLLSREELEKRIDTESEKRTTLSFYRYVHIDAPAEFRDTFYGDLERLDVLGRIYVANEGVNGQISIPSNKVTSLNEYFENSERLRNTRLNIARQEDGASFLKLVIKVRKKIVADGLNDDSFDVTNKGVHLDAKSFNALADDENTVIVDMRNHYESEVGHFKNAITPDVETFRESLPIVEDLLEPHKDKQIVMYCTGGIRCEKASAYFKHKGFEKIYQLEGGIIEYARQVEEQSLENKFRGKNFVFDERLGERITDEVISRCHQCGKPSDRHTNCANNACHILFIQCEECAAKMDGCCSTKCQDFIALPQEEQIKRRPFELFNGTKFGKGRYKAHRSDHELE